MRSLFEKKTAVILLALIALGSLTFLSIGLRNVSFSKGQAISREEAGQESLAPSVEKNPLAEIPRSTQLIVIVSFLILLLLIIILLTPEGRKRMLRILFQAGFSAWAIYYLLKNNPELFSLLNFGANNGLGQTPNDELANIPPPVFTPPQPSPLLSYVLTLSLIFALLYLAWKLYRKQMKATSPIQVNEIGNIARSSLHDLSSGLESADVIMNCYYRMSDVIADKRSLRRRDGMTPAEFAARLESSGLPGDAVRGLTRLFEGVRYGRNKAGADERKTAVECLTSIVEYCGETV